MRLDQALGLFSSLSLRARQEHIRQGLVLVDGRRGRKGDRVTAGQQVILLASVPEAVDLPDVRVVRQSDSYAAIFKPGGLHVVRGKGRCLEDALPALGLEGWTLLNRLDYLTSGLVLAARSAEDAARYKAWQDARLVQKYYLALAHGAIEAEFQIANRILDDERKVVRVIEEPDIPLRGTHVRVLEHMDAKTLVLVAIYRGRRHQIRAHLAHAGFPLFGDPVYGLGEAGGLFLHHALLIMPGFTAHILPDWSLPLDRAISVLTELQQV